MGIFDTTTLNNDPARYVVIAVACLPFFLAICYLFRYCGHGSFASTSLQATMYILISLLWGFSLIVSAFDFESSALIVFATISGLLILLCIYALFMSRHKSKHTINMIMQFLVVLGAFCAATSPASESYSQMIVTLTFVPVGLLSIVCHHGDMLGKHLS